jgi:hypothetical protein
MSLSACQSASKLFHPVHKPPLLTPKPQIFLAKKRFLIATGKKFRKSATVAVVNKNINPLSIEHSLYYFTITYAYPSYLCLEKYNPVTNSNLATA